MGSKRLKKILKSNKFKLSLLCATTFAFLLASGQSFAKYYEEQKNNAAAGIATIGSVDFSYNVSRTEVLGDLEIGLYAFIAHFHVTYGVSEVARTSSVDLRLSTMDNNNFLSTNSAHYPVHTAFGIKDGTESTHTKNDVYPSPLHTLVNKEITNENGSKEVISEFTPNINLNTLVGNTTEESKDEELNSSNQTNLYPASFKRSAFTVLPKLFAETILVPPFSFSVESPFWGANTTLKTVIVRAKIAANDIIL